MEKWENQVAGQQGSEMNAKLKEMHEKMAELMESKINQIKKKEREDFLVRIAMMEERLEERHKVLNSLYKVMYVKSVNSSNDARILCPLHSY